MEKYIDEYILKNTNDDSSIYVRKKFDAVYSDLKDCFKGKTVDELTNLSIAWMSGWLAAGEQIGRLTTEESRRLFQIVILYAGA